MTVPAGGHRYVRTLVVALVAIGCCAMTWAAAWAQSNVPAGGRIPDTFVARGKGVVAEASFADPVTRYRHFVLGAEFEPETLVVMLRSGERLRLTLPPDSVFEDREPRLADLDGDGIDEIIVIRSYLQRGAALAVIAVRNGALQIIAETPPIGAPNRWLNPAGIADFDGDGRMDIAYVDRPHILGLLRVVTLRDGRLVEIAQAPGFSNHVAGSRHLRLSAIVTEVVAGRPRSILLLPNRSRTGLRMVTFSPEPQDVGCIPLFAPLATNLVAVGGEVPAYTIEQGGSAKPFAPISPSDPVHRQQRCG